MRKKLPKNFYGRKNKKILQAGKFLKHKIRLYGCKGKHKKQTAQGKEHAKMAAAKTVLSQTMSINVEDGFDGEGTAQTKAHTYSGIKKDAGADELVKAGTALGSLMENEVVNIVVTEKAEVAEAE